MMVIPLKLSTILIFVLTIATPAWSATEQRGKEKLIPPQPAPAFNIKDVNGRDVSLAYFKGKKVLLTFYRNVGCPICNLRFHELQEQAAYFKQKGLILLAVYESSAEKLNQYLEGEEFYATMIPNPDESLYNLYQVERSTGKLMKGMFHGAISKMKKGKKLSKKRLRQDGNANRIGADFLIDENGNIKTAYYGKYVGDHLSIGTILNFVNN